MVARSQLLACVLAALLPSVRARACASCNCGDPTLTASGLERPYKNRVRVAVEERYGSLGVGDSSSGQRVDFLRSVLVGSWSPTSRLTLSALLPWSTAWIQPVGGRRAEANGLGDLELAARGVIYRERNFSPHHLVWLTGGLKFPTGPRVYDGDGYPLSDDDQPGSGSFDPFAGASYAWFSGELLSAYGSASFRYPTAGPRGYRRGAQLGGSAALQVQPWLWGAFVLGADITWAAPDTLPSGAASPSTGGLVGYVAPALLVSPRTDLLIRLVVDVPVVRVLYGEQSVGPQVALSLAYDIR